MAVTALVVVSPLESGLLPGRLGEVLETPQAQAQDPPPSFTEGTPEPCPVNPFVWRPAAPGDGFGTDGSECIVKLPACPISPVRLGLMRLSVPAQHTIDAFKDEEEAVLSAVLANAVLTHEVRAALAAVLTDEGLNVGERAALAAVLTDGDLTDVQRAAALSAVFTDDERAALAAVFTDEERAVLAVLTEGDATGVVGSARDLLSRLSAVSTHADYADLPALVMEALRRVEEPLRRFERALRRVEGAVNDPADAALRPGWLPAGMIRYPEFCEDWAPEPGVITDDDTNVDEAGLYQLCRSLRGYVRIDLTATTGTVCRVLTPIECPTFTAVNADGSTFTVAAHRTGSQSCAAVRRRAWNCGDGYLPANTFNSCYQPASERLSDDCSPDGSDTSRQPCWPDIHPACVDGAPEFPLGPSEEFRLAHPNSTATPSQLACAEYVGDDFTLQRSCRHGPDAEPEDIFSVSFDPGGNFFWCSYEAWLLRPECHRILNRPPDCATSSPASCIKRASRTGGCDRVGQTIWCRVLQAALERGDRTADEVEQSGCRPCQHLPFQELPSHCASADTSRPRSDFGALERVLTVKRDFPAQSRYCFPAVQTTDDYINNRTCNSRPVCADPPPGRVTWTSPHPSGLAIVNSVVEVSVVDIPLQRLSGDRIEWSSWRKRFVADGVSDFGFTDAVAAGLTSLGRLTTINLRDGRGDLDATAMTGSGATECSPVHNPRTVNDGPYFDLIVEELWPDTPAGRAEILALFGQDSLDWWESLGTQAQRDRTRARGLDWWPDLSTDDSRAERTAELTVQIECAGNDPPMCRWTPARSGYFKLTAGGAWHMSSSNVRNWGNSNTLGRTINEALEDANERNRVLGLLNRLGLDAQDIGLEPGSIGVLGLNPACGEDGSMDRSLCPSLGSRDDLFAEDRATTARCPDAIDVRVACGGTGSNYNYTETEPVGVMVHEVRVNTVMPSR